MTTLLTLNGIPPQVITALDADVQEDVIHAAIINGSYDAEPPLCSALHNRLVACYADWGASIMADSFFYMISRQLQKKGYSFPNDSTLHADQLTAPDNLKNNVLLVRTLMVSSSPAHFIDLTDQPNMPDIMDGYRNEPGSRKFRPEFMIAATGHGGKIVTPHAWDFVAFDGMTPHLPMGASIENLRLLFNGWTPLRLPNNWRERVRDGDVPRWNPS